MHTSDKLCTRHFCRSFFHHRFGCHPCYIPRLGLVSFWFEPSFYLIFRFHGIPLSDSTVLIYFKWTSSMQKMISRYPHSKKCLVNQRCQRIRRKKQAKWVPTKRSGAFCSVSIFATNAEICSRWTAEEHRLFLDGIVKFGKDWKKMQPLIKTRSLIQIRFETAAARVKK